MNDERCDCGARIMVCDLVKVKDGLNLYVYRCGVCGSQVDFVYDGDPKKI